MMQKRAREAAAMGVRTVAVAAPAQTTRPIVTETVTPEPSTPGVNTFVRSLDNDRYQLIEKKGDKEVYRDGLFYALPRPETAT